MQSISVKFDKQAFKEYRKLQNTVNKKARPSHSQLLKSIDTAIRNISKDYRYGDLIPRKYLSKSTIRRYGTDKILRVELVGYWRMLYTIIGDEATIIAFILEFMDHDKYNKIFGYRKP